MAERTDQRTREEDIDEDIGLDEEFGVDDGFGEFGSDNAVEAESTENSGGFREKLPGGGSKQERKGLRGRIADRIGGIFSIRSFGVALVLTVALAFVAGSLIPVVPASSLLGVFAAGFLLGAVGDERQYLEVGAATLMSGAITALVSNLLVAFLGAGIPLVAIGAGASGVAGLLGHYFGRDLRDGLSRDI